jgi:hypothetical protein
MALVEDGIDAFAFHRTKGTRENVVIRVARRHGPIYVFTAFAEGDIFVIGKSDHFIRARFDLANPGCWGQIRTPSNLCRSR